MKNLKLLCLVSLCFSLSACTPAEQQAVKTDVKTALDLAEEACRFEFGQTPNDVPPGISLEQFCQRAEVLQPFLDHLLSAKMAASANAARGFDAGAPK